MIPEENAFQQIVAYCKAIGKPVTMEREGWSTTEDDVHRYVSGFKKEGVFAEDKFLEDFRNTINSNLDNGLEHADTPFALNGILHSAKTLRTAVMYGQSLVDVDGLAARVAERTFHWLAETSYDRMESFDIDDERFQFSFGQPPLLTKLREAEKTIEEIKGLCKKKVHQTVLYQWFDVCYAQNGDFERAEELRTEVKRWDYAYTDHFRHVDKLLKSHSLDFI